MSYTGHHEDYDLELTDMGGRVYDPLAARFTTADPVTQAPFWSQGLNPYAYVFNDPINATDPSGYSAWSTGSTSGDIVTYGVAGTAFGTVGYGIVTEIGSALLPAGGALGSAAGSAGGSALNMLGTLALSPGGPPPGATWQTAAPSAAPTPHQARVNSMGSAPGQSQPPGPMEKSVAAPQTTAQKGPVDPLKDRSRFAGAEHDIARAMYGIKGKANPLRAAELAMQFWEAHVDKVYLDRAIPDFAETAHFTDNTIETTFNPDKFRSPRFLLSTARHEGIVHAGQFNSGNFASYPKDGFYVNEVEALDNELQMAPRLGLSSDDISVIQQLRDHFYHKLDGSPYQQRIDAGNYQLF